MYHYRMQILPKIDKWSQLRAENNPLHATTFLDSLLPPETRRDTSNRFRQMEGVKALSTRHPGSR